MRAQHNTNGVIKVYMYALFIFVGRSASPFDNDEAFFFVVDVSALYVKRVVVDNGR